MAGKIKILIHIAGLADLASVGPYAFRELVAVGVQTNIRKLELTPMNTDPKCEGPEGTFKIRIN